MEEDVNDDDDEISCNGDDNQSDHCPFESDKGSNIIINSEDGYTNDHHDDRMFIENMMLRKFG